MSDPRVQGSRGECEIAVRHGGLAELGAGVLRAAPNAKTVMLALPWKIMKKYFIFQLFLQ